MATPTNPIPIIPKSQKFPAPSAQIGVIVQFDIRFEPARGRRDGPGGYFFMRRVDQERLVQRI